VKFHNRKGEKMENNAFYVVSGIVTKKKMIFALDYSKDEKKPSLILLPYHKKASFENSDYYPVGSRIDTMAKKLMDSIIDIAQNYGFHYKGLGYLDPKTIELSMIDCILNKTN
jgi:hypothetical protein